MFPGNNEVLKNANNIPFFKTHLNLNLKRVFLIIGCQSSVVLSVCMSARLKMKRFEFSTFFPEPLSQTWHKVSLGEGDLSFFNKEPYSLLKGDN